MTIPEPVCRIVKAALAAILVLTFIAGCTSFRSAFSRGAGALSDAQRAKTEGRYPESLSYAMDALAIDPGFASAWQFLRDNYVPMNDRIVAGLSVPEIPIDLSEAEKRARGWASLVKLTERVRSLPLPYRDPSGWSWSPPSRDYTDRAKAERKRVFDLYFARGLQSVASGDIAAARTAFTVALDDFADEASGERFQGRSRAASACITFAAPLARSFDLVETRKAVDAYRLAQEFEPANARARDGIRIASLHVAELYVSQGMSREYRDRDDDLKEAVKLYAEALSWDPEQPDASWLLPRAKETLAERAWQRGRSLEESGTVADGTSAVTAYREALGYVPGYRDSMIKVYLIPARFEVAAFSPTLAPLGDSLARIKESTGRVPSEVAAVGELLKNLRSLSSKVADLQSRSTRVSKRIASLTEGGSLSPLATSLASTLGNLWTPMGRVAAASGEGDALLLVPLSESLESWAEFASRAKTATPEPKAIAGRSARVVELLPECMESRKTEKELERSLQSLLDLVQGRAALSTACSALESALTSASRLSAKLAQDRLLLTDAFALAATLEAAIRQLEDAARDLDAAMRETISLQGADKKISVRVKDVLARLPDEAKPYEDRFRMAADTALGNLRSRLAPSLPAADQFTRVGIIIEELSQARTTYDESRKAGEVAIMRVEGEGVRMTGSLDALGQTLGCTF